MNRKLVNVLQIAVIIISLMAAFILASHPADGARRPSECQRWAYDIGEDGSPDSFVMHTIGCDDGPNNDGVYNRDEGRCAGIARAAYRKGYRAASLELEKYMLTRGCDMMEEDDGTYDDLRANRP